MVSRSPFPFCWENAEAMCCNLSELRRPVGIVLGQIFVDFVVDTDS